MPAFTQREMIKASHRKQVELWWISPSTCGDCQGEKSSRLPALYVGRKRLYCIMEICNFRSRNAQCLRFWDFFYLKKLCFKQIHGTEKKTLFKMRFKTEKLWFDLQTQTWTWSGRFNKWNCCFMKTTQFDYKICKIMIVPESIAINYNIVILWSFLSNIMVMA